MNLLTPKNILYYIKYCKNIYIKNIKRASSTKRPKCMKSRVTFENLEEKKLFASIIVSMKPIT